MSSHSLPELRALIATHRPRISSEGYRTEIRAAVVDAARERLAEGWTPTRLGRELGLAATTVTAWLRDPPAASFRSVTVTDGPAEAAPTSLTMVTPGGYRVEGLDLAAVTALLARLP